MLQVFLELVIEDGWPAYRGGKWMVRRVADTQALVPRSHGVVVNVIPFAWNLVEHDIPTYPDHLGLIPKDLREEFAQLPNWSGLLVDRFLSGRGTRVGGWPKWVDGHGLGGIFCLQLDGSDCGIDMSFDGNLYFGFDEAEETWECVWEIG